MIPDQVTIGFIGAGNMASAMMGALSSAGVSGTRLKVSDVSEERLAAAAGLYGAGIAPDNRALFAASDAVILAVKPQQMGEVLAGLAPLPDFSGRKLVLSIAAGVRIETIEDRLYAGLSQDARARLPIVRAMPNTPALVRAGACGMAANREASPEDRDLARSSLETTGLVREFPEEDLDAVTAVSGSGPAYVFFLAEVMLEAARNLGLPPEDGRDLVTATLKGASLLLEQSGENPESLRRKVTSPGGTTQAAFEVLFAAGVKEAFLDALAAAAHRARVLSGAAGR